MSRRNDPNKPRPSVSKKRRAAHPDRVESPNRIGKHGRIDKSASSEFETKRIDFADLVAARESERQLEEERIVQQKKVDDALSSTASMEALVEVIETPEEPKVVDDPALIDEADVFDEPAPESKERRTKLSSGQKRRAEKKALKARQKREKEEREKEERAAKAAERNSQRDAQSRLDFDAPEDQSQPSDSPKPKKALLPPEIKRKRKRGLIVLAIILAIALVAAICVAYFTFVSNMNSKIALKDDNLTTVLVAPEEKEQPYYALVEVEYFKTSRYYKGPGLIALLRIDPVNDVVTTMIVPPNTNVSLSDGEYHNISEAQTIGGDSYLVSVVSKLFKVNIAHVVRIDDEGLQHMVDHFGGIQIDVPEVVDDPDAGDIYIDAGKQTLDGAATVVLTKADNYNDPVAVRSANQAAVIQQLLTKAVESGNSGFSTTLDALKGDFKTDLKTSELHSLLKDLNSENGIKFYSACIPGEIDVETGGKVFYASKNTLAKVMDAVNSDGNPEDVDEDALEKKSVYIEVRNGSKAEGAAVQVKKALYKDGWGVSFTSNAESDAYGETLVVYRDKDMEPAAKALVKDLGVGRVIEAGDNYEFGTDLLVVVGADWKPQS